MISFMFAVLGSVIFWVVWALISLLGGTLTIKTLAPRTWRFATEGYRDEDDLYIHEVVVVLLCCFLFWPIVALAFFIYHFFNFVGQYIIWKPLCYMIKLIDKNTPTISIKKN